MSEVEPLRGPSRLSKGRAKLFGACLAFGALVGVTIPASATFNFGQYSFGSSCDFNTGWDETFTPNQFFTSNADGCDRVAARLYKNVSGNYTLTSWDEDGSFAQQQTSHTPLISFHRAKDGGSWSQTTTCNTNGCS